MTRARAVAGSAATARADRTDWLSNDHDWREACKAGAFECVAFDGTCRCAVTFFRKGRF